VNPEDVPAEIVAKVLAVRWEKSPFPEHVREQFRQKLETSIRRQLAAVWDDVRAAP
jgi:hypothetical protein